ncbi:MAG TPA: hypothetical protein VFA27_01410 [Vicinamibacterales bacterium]|nr:hypothetical protein [Vicinamibacterales bacterium]
MRGLSLMLALLLSTALSAAPQRHPTPPPQPPPSHQPPPPASSPTVMPFPPLPPQPAGGLTPGVTFPFQDNPVYSPSRVRPLPRGFGFGGYGGYGGGYYYAPDATSAGAPATMAAAPQMETGMLRLDGTPASAQVFVDGYYVATLADVEASRVLTLPAGPHRVEIRASDYLPTTFDVRIDPNATVTYHASLDHVRPAPPVRAAAPAASAKMYLIPNCYLGNIPPKQERLPRGCDAKRVQVIN